MLKIQLIVTWCFLRNDPPLNRIVATTIAQQGPSQGRAGMLRIARPQMAWEGCAAIRTTHRAGANSFASHSRKSFAKALAGSQRCSLHAAGESSGGSSTPLRSRPRVSRMPSGLSRSFRRKRACRKLPCAESGPLDPPFREHPAEGEIPCGTEIWLKDRNRSFSAGSGGHSGLDTPVILAGSGGHFEPDASIPHS